MKAEHLILGVGAVFIMVVIGTAMMPDDLSVRDHPAPGMAPVMTLAGPQPQFGAVGVQPQFGAAGIQPQFGAAAAAPGVPWAQNAAMPGLIPFTRAVSQRFRGRVVSTVTLGSDMGWGQVHIWIADGAAPVQELSLAPDWYLSYLGCAIGENAQVEGVAFKFDKVQSNVELYAKSITVNGRQCGLRNDEGFALWSNQLK